MINLLTGIESRLILTMGLDWIVEDKPKENCQLQFNTLTELIEQAQEQLEQIDSNSAEFEEAINKYNGLKEQLGSVSVSKYETAKCPKVSKSKKAREYFIQKYLPGIKTSHPQKTDDEILNDFSNFAIVDLSPYKSPNTGFSGLFCSGLDFRGKGIGCSSLLSDELKEEAFQDHRPAESVDYATRMKTHLAQYKKFPLNNEQKEEMGFLMKGIKWLEFWGKRGHGYYAWY